MFIAYTAMNIRAQATGFESSGKVCCRPRSSQLGWEDSLTSWLVFLPESPALPPDTGFIAQRPGLQLHVFFSRCHDSSS